MSFTPDDQKLSAPLFDVTAKIENLLCGVRARLKDPERWSFTHLEEMRSLEVDLVKFRQRIESVKAGD